MFHLGIISQRSAGPFIMRQMVLLLPQFTLLLLLAPWLAWRTAWTSFTERSMAVAYAGGFLYIAARTNFGMWYFVILAPTAAYLFGRMLTQLGARLPRATATVGVAIVVLLAILVCRHGLISTPYSNLANGREMGRLLTSLVDEQVSSGSAVLTSPQFYHLVKRQCDITRDLEYFAMYGPIEDLGRFDYVLCMDERDINDPLHRFDHSQRAELLRRFEVVYDSREAGVQWRSSKLKTWGQLQPIPAIRIFRSKLLPVDDPSSRMPSAGE
jgi:hypothetical protein